MRPIAVIAAALIVGACSSPTTRPSGSGMPSVTSKPPASVAVDCGKPANAAQQLVCSDPHLTELDHRLQTAYQQALARTGADPATLADAQTGWTTARDDCARNVDVHTCVLEAYQTRLVQLAIADPATVAPPVITYRCPADAGPLTAQFYNQFDHARRCSTGKATRRFCSCCRPAAGRGTAGRAPNTGSTRAR